MTLFARGIAQSSIVWILRLTWIDYIRRKDLYVVAACMAIFVLATITIRLIGIENRSTAVFLMSAGLALAGLLAALLTASFSARAFPEEFERRTLIPLMAKPVRHVDVLLGKSLGCLTLSGGSYLAFVIATLLAVPIVPGQQWLALFQVVTLNLISLAFLSAATLTLSFFMPVVVSVLVSLLWYFGGGMALHVIQQSVLARGAGMARWLESLLGCMPDASLLSHTELFANASHPLSAGLFSGLLFYGASWSCILLAAANWKFRRVRL